MYNHSSRSLLSAQLLIYHPHHQKSLDTHTQKLFSPIYIQVVISYQRWAIDEARSMFQILRMQFVI